MTQTPNIEPAKPADPLAGLSFNTVYTLVRQARRYLDPSTHDYRTTPPEPTGDLSEQDTGKWQLRLDQFRARWQEQPEPLRAAILARAFPPGPRQCYWISGLDMDKEQTGYIPALVVENEPGYSLMAGNGPFAAPWIWGATLDQAEAVCQRVNRERFYLEPDETNEIVISSMNASREKRGGDGERG